MAALLPPLLCILQYLYSYLCLSLTFRLQLQPAPSYHSISPGMYFSMRDWHLSACVPAPFSVQLTM